MNIDASILCMMLRGVLNTQIGQLVIASAVLDDIISLVLLGIVAALDDPTPFKLAKPLVVSGGFLLLFGYICNFVLQSFILHRIIHSKPLVLFYH